MELTGKQFVSASKQEVNLCKEDGEGKGIAIDIFSFRSY